MDEKERLQYIIIDAAYDLGQEGDPTKMNLLVEQIFALEVAAQQSVQPTGLQCGHFVAICNCEVCSAMRRLPKDASG